MSITQSKLATGLNADLEDFDLDTEPLDSTDFDFDWDKDFEDWEEDDLEEDWEEEYKIANF